MSRTVALLLAAAILAPSPPALAAGTWFRLTQDGPRWWLVDPDGNRFFSTGVNCVAPKDGGARPGHRRYDATRAPGFSRERWTEETLRRLRGWGFNTVGGWSDDAAYGSGLPFVVVLSMSDEEGLIRVFDPAFPELVRARAEPTVRRWRDARTLIGWFTDNELPWQGRGRSPGPRTLLQRFAALAADTPGKTALVQFFRSRYRDDFAAFAKGWLVTADSFDALPSVGQWVPVGYAGYDDVEAWAGEVASEYGRIAAAVLKELDPNHLNLGVRFAGDAPDPVIRALGPYSDAISVNYYRRTGRVSIGQLARIHTLSGGKPILISEFSWRARANRSGSPNRRGQDVTVPTQADRAARCRTYLTELLTAPFVIGYHFFMWFDQPPAGRIADGEDSNYGLVDLHDRPYAVLTNALREINVKAAALHESSRAVPVPPAGTAVTPSASPVVHAPTLVLARGRPPPEPPVYWGDRSAGARATRVNVATDPEAWFGFRGDTGSRQGSGFGWRFPLTQNGRNGRDLGGTAVLVFRLRVTRGKAFRVFLAEATSGWSQRNRVEGRRGADGESWSTPEYQGTGQWTDYTVPLTRLELRKGHGKPNGNERVDVQDIAWFDLYCPEDQGEVEGAVGRVTAAPAGQQSLAEPAR